MDLALNDQQRLLCHKTQTTKPNQILMHKFCTFKPLSTDCEFDCTRSHLPPFKILLALKKHLLTLGVVPPTSSTMNNESRNYMNSGRNIRDFGQLLTSLYPHLQHLIREQKYSTPNPCLSSFIRNANKKCIVPPHYIYIYIDKKKRTTLCKRFRFVIIFPA